MDRVPRVAGSEPEPAPRRRAPAPAGLVERLRAVHLRMVDAVLGGEGLSRVAALAADAGGGAVAIVVPRLGAAVAAPAIDDETLSALRRYVADRVKDRPAQVPAAVAAEVPIGSGDELVGAVLLVGGEAGADAAEFLHLAAVASLTEVAVEEAKDEVEDNLRGSFLEDLRSRPDPDAPDVVRRAGRLGCDLSRGAVALCAELTSERRRHVVATIAEDVPGALAQHVDGRVHALLPASGGDDAPENTLARARRLAERLRRHGTVGLSSFYADPAELPRALQEAELVLTSCAGPTPPAGPTCTTSARGPTACCFASSRRTPRRSAASTRTPSRRSSATTISTAPTWWARSRRTSSTTAT